MWNNEKGNVVVFILIAVFLFGALYFTFSRTMHSSKSNITKQQVKVEITNLLNYARRVENAVDKVRKKGCSESQISFLYDSDGDGTVETNGQDNYYNPDAPVDESCHIFSPNGGKITYVSPSQTIRVGSEITSTTPYNTPEFIFIAFNEIIDVGSTGPVAGDGADLILVLPFLTEISCNEVNNKMNIAGNLTQEDNIALGSSTADLFHGLYGSPYTEEVFDIANGVDLRGRSTGCMNEIGSASAGFHFYHVLLAR